MLLPSFYGNAPGRVRSPPLRVPARVTGMRALWMMTLAAILTLCCNLGTGQLESAEKAQESQPNSQRMVVTEKPEAGEAPKAGPAAIREKGSGPYLRVVGTVQDGGLPHAACSCERCERARTEPAHRRHVASLAIVLPKSEQVFLIDATPDLREQLVLLRGVRNGPQGRVDRQPIDGVLLTHAHIGHYLGLAFLGFEVVHTQGLPVYCTPKMARFLRSNGPWSQLLSMGNLRLVEVEPGESFELGEGVSVEVLAVPHRDEYSDTVAFLVSGPSQRVLYVPDTDAWSAWPRPLPEVLTEVDVALLDGTFYSLDELPGRAVSSVGHPLVVESMDLLQELVTGGKKIFFTHLNHSNPALDPRSPAREEIEGRGFAVLAEGTELAL